MLAMPAKMEKAGTNVRCLEMRLQFSPQQPFHVTVAFRTDTDRQGENNSVTTWPPKSDPRVPLVLPSLLHGLASKLRQYRVEGARAYTAAIRKATAFVHARELRH